MRTTTFAVVAATLWASALPCPTAAQDAAAGHDLVGRVLDSASGGVPGVTVVLCDAASGIPLRPGGKLRMTQGEGDPSKIAHVATDAEGRFRFAGLPPGDYRLIAQSWSERESIEDVFGKNGAEVQLRGVAESVAVPPTGAEPLEIRPLGSATLVIQQQVEKDSHSLVLISPKPLAADPVLLFVSWSGPFLQNLQGGCRTYKGRVVFNGLAPGKYHLAFFTNDNNPGTGGLAVEVPADQPVVVEIPVIASWSNGIKDPPERLRPLVEKVGAMGSEVAEEVRRQLGPDFFRSSGRNRQEIFARQIAVLEREIVLPDGTWTTGADLLAAFAYLQLQR